MFPPNNAFQLPRRLFLFLNTMMLTGRSWVQTCSAKRFPALCRRLRLVGTGLEDKAAADSGQVVLCRADGEVVEVDANHITVKEEGAAGKNAKRIIGFKVLRDQTLSPA